MSGSFKIYINVMRYERERSLGFRNDFMYHSGRGNEVRQERGRKCYTRIGSQPLS